MHLVEVVADDVPAEAIDPKAGGSTTKRAWAALWSSGYDPRTGRSTDLFHDPRLPVFNIFRRSRPTPLAPQTQEGQPRPLVAPDAAAAPATPVPPQVDIPALPEVVEGNADTDWKLWEQALTSPDGKKPSQWMKTWPGMDAPPPATPSQLEETVRMVRLPPQAKPEEPKE